MKKFFQKLSNKNKNLINRLDSYFFKNKTRKIIFLSISIVVFSGALFVVSVASAGALTFFQSGWTGGLTSNTTNSQTGWNQYSAGTNITAGTNVTLTPNNSTDTQNTFTSYTYQSGQGVYLSGGLSMLKPNGASCGADAQCSGGWCALGSCKSCSGSKVNGYCWYASTQGTACSTYCSSYGHGSCTNASLDLSGETSVCHALWPSSMIAGLSGTTTPRFDGGNWCYIQTNTNGQSGVVTESTCSVASQWNYNACACGQ